MQIQQNKMRREFTPIVKKPEYYQKLQADLERYNEKLERAKRNEQRDLKAFEEKEHEIDGKLARKWRRKMAKENAPETEKKKKKKKKTAEEEDIATKNPFFEWE